MKALTGIVTSTRMNKTVAVEVRRIWVHPVYQKRIHLKKKFHAHDEIGVKEGDKVKMTETRPVSKTKRWKIVEKLT